MTEFRAKAVDIAGRHGYSGKYDDLINEITTALWTAYAQGRKDEASDEIERAQKGCLRLPALQGLKMKRCSNGEINSVLHRIVVGGYDEREAVGMCATLLNIDSQLEKKGRALEVAIKALGQVNTSGVEIDSAWAGLVTLTSEALDKVAAILSEDDA